MKKSYKVTGMRCASCAARAEKLVSEVPGVNKAAINFADHSLQVEFEEASLTEQQLKDSLLATDFRLVGEELEEQLAAVEKDKKEKRQAFRKMLTAMVLAFPVFLIGMFLPDFKGNHLISLVLTLAVMLVSGRDIYRNAWRQALQKSAGMDTLVALGTGAAFMLSVVSMFFPQTLSQSGLKAHVYFESAAVIIALILLGRFLEARAKDSTSQALRKLMNLGEKNAWRWNNGELAEVPVQSVRVGDELQVKPGAVIPLDGVLLEGSSYVDESMLTGEPLAVLKQEGHAVVGGTQNQEGTFRFRVTKVGEQTMLSKIIRLVKEAQGSKAPIQKLVDKIAQIFVPVVLLIAAVTFVLWMTFGNESVLVYALTSAVTVLVIACPCALGLATPTALMVGIGRGAEQGILIKNAESLERISKTDTVVLDKTGTLTKGKPEVSELVWCDELSEQEQLQTRRVLKTAEQKSEHPLAGAVVRYLEEDELCSLTDFVMHAGKGISVGSGEYHWHIGNAALMKQENVVFRNGLQDKAGKLESQGKSVVYVAKDGRCLGFLAMADQIKNTSLQAVRELRGRGIDVHMLTGDNRQTAQAIAGQIGIQEYVSDCLPDDKLRYVKELQQQGRVVAMVGDGINDSPALAQADVGIAMGTGTDIAMESADLTLVKGDLQLLNSALLLSKSTVRTIRQNLFWAFCYNVVGIPVAAGVLFPFFGFLLNPMIAGGAMAFSSVSVVMNSLRLRRRRI
ncbi:MAG: heavy metal translocating P-type ATPase [Cytophagales bacterium]|nr:heavy metal translocating P-type ATPase [Cytophagales bacterium]